jgi:two-component system cell cycle sensor histidine kinase/response regulator CckA
VGGIAHDFNNLLMAVMGNVEILRRRLPHDSPERPHVEEIEKAAGTAADLTTEMLACTGTGSFVAGNIDLSQTIEEIMGILAISIPKKMRIVRRLARGLPAIETHATQVQQVAMDLIRNTTEAIGENAAGEITITTRVVEFGKGALSKSYIPAKCLPGRYVFLTVSDTGCGIEAEAMVRMFDPFYSTKFPGRGLGLAVVLEIVREHGARSWRRRYRGTGTVLLVDDDESVGTVARLMLEEMGYLVLVASNGRTAMKSVR